MRSLFLPELSALVIILASGGPVVAQPFTDSPTSSSPALATYAGYPITLLNLEEYVFHLPKLQRVPRLVDGAIWRKHMCRELTAEILFTSQALATGLMRDPALQRARNYFMQEWLSYAMLRDNVVNNIDISNERLREFYAAHEKDYFLSPTISLRMIRTRNKEKADQAVARIIAGETFGDVETSLSEVSVKQRGKILGPFPSTTETVTFIPPPDDVIKAAWELEVGQTTGPIFLNQNYFIVQTAARTPGDQKTFEQVVELIDARIRQVEGDERTRNFTRSLREEIGVVQMDDALTSEGTKMEDVIATVGQLLITFGEYTVLNGRVRGPAADAAMLEPTALRRFIVPAIFAEGARRRGYTERDEFYKALLFHDLRRFGSRMLGNEADRRTPRVTEAEIRQYYNIAKNTKDEHGHVMSESLEQSRDGIHDLLHQKKRGETEQRLKEEALDNSEFAMIPEPVSSKPTALEALVAVADKIPPGYQIRMISTAGDEKDPVRQIPTSVLEAGRRSTWRLLFTKGDDTSDVLELHPPETARIFDATEHFTSNPLFLPWNGIWRFDTDALARLAYDSGINDFMAKYEKNIHINTRVEFEWKNNRPNDCWLVFELRPIGEGPDRQILTLRYSAQSGSMSRKPLFECLPCEAIKRILNEPI